MPSPKQPRESLLVMEAVVVPAFEQHVFMLAFLFLACINLGSPTRRT
jgi:hypothetical protein